MTVEQWRQDLGNLLSALKCPMTVGQLWVDTSECWHAVRADARHHGDDVEAPFFNFVVAGDVAVFTIFDGDLAVYAFRCDERTAVTSMRGLAMAHVELCREILASKHGKPAPDLVLPHELIAAWLTA